MQGSQGPAGQVAAQPWRAHSVCVLMTLAHASVALVDDRYGNNIEVLALQLQASSLACLAAFRASLSMRGMSRSSASAVSPCCHPCMSRCSPPLSP